MKKVEILIDGKSKGTFKENADIFKGATPTNFEIGKEIDIQICFDGYHSTIYKIKKWNDTDDIFYLYLETIKK